jgi:hypothetical protein
MPNSNQPKPAPGPPAGKPPGKGPKPMDNDKPPQTRIVLDSLSHAA